MGERVKKRKRKEEKNEDDCVEEEGGGGGGEGDCDGRMASTVNKKKKSKKNKDVRVEQEGDCDGTAMTSTVAVKKKKKKKKSKENRDARFEGASFGSEEMREELPVGVNGGGDCDGATLSVVAASKKKSKKNREDRCVGTAGGGDCDGTATSSLMKEQKKKKKKKNKDAPVIPDGLPMEINGEGVSYAAETMKKKKHKKDKGVQSSDLGQSSECILERPPSPLEDGGTTDKDRRKTQGVGTATNVNESKKKKVGRAKEASFSDLPVEIDEYDQEQSSVSQKKRKKRKHDQVNGGSLPSGLDPKKPLLEGKVAGEGNLAEINSLVDVRKQIKKKNIQGNVAVLLSEGVSNEETARKSSKSKTRKMTKQRANSDIPDSTDKDLCITRNHRPKKKTKKVSFSGHVEVFPSNDASNDSNLRKDHSENGVITGKRLTVEENELIKETVYKYIEEHNLGDEGVYMVLHSQKYPETRGLWKELATLLPWRNIGTVYKRVHVIFASKRGKWMPEELEIIKRHHEKSGSTWREVAGLLGRFRDHIKDAWRRYRLPNRKRGRWSQDEYQQLFDLVNLDLRMKVGEEKNAKHGNMLKENIAWYSISNKLSTRTHVHCCNKWYSQLSSSMVVQGLWADCDDYLLIDALQKLDACCVEDVDWDHLVEHRSGDVCRKRWTEMTLHIGGYREKSFVEQVDILSSRYCPEMYEYRIESTKNENKDEDED